MPFHKMLQIRMLNLAPCSSTRPVARLCECNQNHTAAPLSLTTHIVQYIQSGRTKLQTTFTELTDQGCCGVVLFLNVIYVSIIFGLCRNSLLPSLKVSYSRSSEMFYTSGNKYSTVRKSNKKS